MKACGICKYDIKCFEGKVDSPRYNNAPGHEGVGIVEEVGIGVEDIKPGDNVTSMAHGGAMAEYFIAERNAIAKIPDGVKAYEYWVAEPVACAVCALRLLRIEPGDRVVVVGCGYMGLLLIQGLPKEFVSKIVAVDIDESRLELARRYGADEVVNANSSEFVAAVTDSLAGEADIVIEAVGLPGLISKATGMTRMGGRLCIFGHHDRDEAVPTDAWHMKGIEVLNTTPFASKNFHKDLVDAVKLMDKKVFDQTELISKTYPFADIGRAMKETSSKASELIKTVLINQ